MGTWEKKEEEGVGRRILPGSANPLGRACQALKGESNFASRRGESLRSGVPVLRHPSSNSIHDKGSQNYGVKETDESTWEVTPRLGTVQVAKVRISLDLCIPTWRSGGLIVEVPAMLKFSHTLSFGDSDS